MMTTFTTDDRIKAGIFSEDEQMRILTTMVSDQYNQVRNILDHVKEKPLESSEIMEISKQYADRYEFARAIEKAHHIGE
jgi:signal transduction histidine kinase